MQNYIKEVELLTIRPAHYTMYVFREVNTKELIMCTRLPNWQTPDVSIGDVGFLQYQAVFAGESFYDPATEKTHVYKYTNLYFINFVLKNLLKNSEIIL
jgi:hypothetical protein